MDNSIDFVKRPVTVVGMGMSGEAAKRLLVRNGVSKRELSTFDQKEGAAEYHDPEVLWKERKPGTLVVSPGVPLQSEWIQDFRERGVKITSEIALAYDFLTTEQVIGVTGSVGKSTTVALLEEGLKAFSPHSFMGGNFGRPLADYVCDLQEGKRERAPWVVLELSSYQLENFGNLQCKYSLFTFLTPNHLERYDSLTKYYETKWALAEITKSAVILNRRGGDLLAFAKKHPLDKETIVTDQYDESLREHHLQEALLLGSHNQDNLAMAAKLATRAGWPNPTIEAMKKFPGLSHRMENLGKHSGVIFINDSKATTMESVITAANGVYEQMDRKNQLILLIGGKDKNLPWEQLEVLKRIQKLRPVFFGSVGELAKKKSGLGTLELYGESVAFEKLAPALKFLKSIAKPGDIVLLSPGGTSLDEFKNFEERGNSFRKLVTEIFPH